MTMTFTPQAHPPQAQQPRVHQRRPRQTHDRVEATLSLNVLLAAAVAVLIVFGLVGFGGDAAADSPAEAISPNSEMVDAIEVYVVKPGDTLWAIATEVARPGEDIRPIVDELKQITGGSALDVGQRIIIDHTTIRG